MWKELDAQMLVAIIEKEMPQSHSVLSLWGVASTTEVRCIFRTFECACCSVQATALQLASSSCWNR